MPSRSRQARAPEPGLAMAGWVRARGRRRLSNPLGVGSLPGARAAQEGAGDQPTPLRAWGG